MPSSASWYWLIPVLTVATILLGLIAYHLGRIATCLEKRGETQELQDLLGPDQVPQAQPVNVRPARRP